MAVHNFPLPPSTGASDDNNIDALIREIYLLQQAGLVTQETSVTGLVNLISISNPALVPPLLRVIRDQNTAIGEVGDGGSKKSLDHPTTAVDYSVDVVPENIGGPDRGVGLSRAASRSGSSEGGDSNAGGHASADQSSWTNGMERVEVDALLNNDSERRTTVMIKKIPRRFTVSTLRDLIEKECPALQNGGYDLLYLPVDTAKVANRGYAFINFTTPRYLLVFTLVFQGYEWFPLRKRRTEGLNNTKACEIYFAHIQGKEATIRSVDPTGSKRSNSPNYESIGDDKVWILGFTDSRKKRVTTTTATNTTTTTYHSSSSYPTPRPLRRNGVFKPHYARCLSNASTSSNTTPRGDSLSSSSLPLLTRAISCSCSNPRQSPMVTSVSGCNRRPHHENNNHTAESSNSRARDF